MKCYVARQPIYDVNKSLFGYELLYRNSEDNFFSGIDEDKATRELTYNVLSEFEFNSLTNDRYGLINFTKNSLMSDIPFLFDPDKVIIEILENVILDEDLVDRIVFLKERNYTIALNDFVDDGTYDEIIPYIDIIKIEYNLLEPKVRKNIAKKYGSSKKLIAERIETQKDYFDAMADGYNFFQGYYFSKPAVISRVSINLASSTYVRLLNELSVENPCFSTLEKIIKTDIGLTYKLFSLANSANYYRGNKINSIKQALFRLGIYEIKKWLMLILISDISNSDDDEFTKLSLIRATFMEKLILKLGLKSMCNDAYMIGLSSIIDNLLNQESVNILEKFGITESVRISMNMKTGVLYETLECIKEYELSNWSKVEDFTKEHNLDIHIITSTYLESVRYADEVFNLNESMNKESVTK